MPAHYPITDFDQAASAAHFVAVKNKKIVHLEWMTGDRVRILPPQMDIAKHRIAAKVYPSGLVEDYRLCFSEWRLRFASE